MAMQDDGIDQIKVSQVSLDVPSLGQITGLCYDGETCQYLGIPYATIPGRFRRPQPAPAWPSGSWDGTKLGPYCPQPPRDFYPIPVPRRPWLEGPSTSESECLNLNISVPHQPGKASGALPVMVFLHGGAFAYAAGSAAMYDGRELAKISRDDEGTPTIIISINYRLGVLGFLAGHDIKAYNESFGESGVGNYGLWDQIEALRWVQKHIAGFGGDPARVTLFGQSAGGVSTNVHLLRNEALFSSAILQSGVLPLCGIMTESEYEIIYRKMLLTLGIDESLSSQERLQKLIEIPEPELTKAMVEVFITPVVTISPCDDGVIIPSPMPTYSSFTEFKAPEWCTRIMIGDAASEAIIWNKAFRYLTSSTDVFHAYAEKVVGKDAAKTLLRDIYNFNDSTLSPSALLHKIDKFATDSLFLAMNYDFMCAYPDCYAYHFDEPSPYDNEWGGLAHHSFENIFIWSVLRHTLPPAQVAQSKRMSGMWLQFANGKAPWEQFGAEGKMMVFGPKGRAEVKTREQDKDRGYDKWEQVRKAGLVDQWGLLADDICMRRRDILNPAVKPQAMEVPDWPKDPSEKAIGVL